MTQVQAYLGFQGNCAQAMRFYQEAFGGTLEIMTVGESPVKDGFPEAQQAHVVHASLTDGALTLFGADLAQNTQPSNLVSLMVQCGPADDVAGLFARLSEGGTVTQPLGPSFWGSTFGQLTDRYGVGWMLNQEGSAER